MGFRYLKIINPCIDIYSIKIPSCFVRGKKREVGRIVMGEVRAKRGKVRSADGKGRVEGGAGKQNEKMVG